MKKILIIRFSSIGDIVLTSPIVRCLKQKFPNSQIHFICKEVFSATVDFNPNITKVWKLSKNFKSIAQTLKQEKFDFVVDLQKNLKSTKLVQQLAVPSGTYDKLNWEKWLLTNFKLDTLPKKHIVKRYFKATKALDVEYDGNGLDFYFPKKDKEILDQLPPIFNSGYYVLVLGAAHQTKSIPISLCVEIIQKLKKKIILLGGKSEVEKASDLLAQLNTDLVLNFVGKTTLGESAALLLNSKVVITPDTGMMHIAAALNKPIVVIWGNTVPQFGMYPFYPEHQNLFINIQVDDLSCRPCSKLGYNKCPKKHFNCMGKIQASEIVAAVKKLRLQI